MEPLSIVNPFPGAAGFYLRETESTMNDVRKLSRLGFPPGTTVVAGTQTAGRGRFPERKWEASPDQNLLATTVLGPEASGLPGFPLRIGLAICRAIDLFTLQYSSYPVSGPRIKWPNDVLIEGRKLAGILCEASDVATFVGYGVNLNQRYFQPPLDRKATSLAIAMEYPEGSPPLDPNHLLELILEQFALVLREESWREDVEALLYQRGERVRFLEGLPEANRVFEGELVGVSSEGSLLIKVDNERTPHAFAAGELIIEEAPRVDRNASNHIR